jgi:hypothetical protein
VTSSIPKKGVLMTNDKARKIHEIEELNRMYRKTIEELEDDPYNLHYTYSTKYFTKPDWMEFEDITLHDFFSHILLDELNRQLTQQDIQMRFILGNIDIYRDKNSNYVRYTYTYKLEPDYHNLQRFIFNFKIIVERGIHKEYPNSLILTMYFESITDIYRKKVYQFDSYSERQKSIHELTRTYNIKDLASLFRVLKKYFDYIKYNTLKLLGLKGYMNDDLS